jgi:putative aldouronate transport system substrate-binding protein
MPATKLWGAPILTGTALALVVGGAVGAQEPVTIRLVSKDLVTTNPADVAHIERIEQAMAERGTPIDIEIVDLPGSSYADALGVMLLSGDIPDLIYFQGGDAKMAEQGILEDWRPWIEQAPNLQAALYPHNEARLENYPYLLYVFPPRASLPVIRTDWLERAGTGVPETVDDYLELFRAIRDGDFDGNGQDDTWAVALAGATGVGGTDELDTIFDRAFGITGTWMQDANGEWISARVSEQERAKLAFYRQLYEEGLLDPEYVTTQWDVKEDKFYTGRAGVVLGTAGEVIDIYGGKLRQVEPEAELTVLPPPSGPGGEGGVRAIDVSKESRGFAMSVLSESKEEVVALMDFLASPEGQMMDRLGFEGEHYVRNGDGIEVTPAISTWYARFMAASNWESPVDWRSEAAARSLEMVDADFVADNAFVVPAELAADLDAATNVQKEWSYRFISGEASLEEDWDDYVAAWNAAGGERLTEYARSQL